LQVNKRSARTTRGISNCQLTQFELSVWSLVAQGYSNIAIATRLKRTVKSIENALRRIYNKLEINDEEGHSRRFRLISNYFTSQASRKFSSNIDSADSMTMKREPIKVGTEQELANLLRNLSVSFSNYDLSLQWLSQKMRQIFGDAGKDWIYQNARNRLDGLKPLFYTPIWKDLPGFRHWVDYSADKLITLFDKEAREVLLTLVKGREVLDIAIQSHWGSRDEAGAENPVALVIHLKKNDTEYGLTDFDCGYYFARHVADLQMQLWSEIALRVALCRIARMLVGAPPPKLMIEDRCSRTEKISPNEIRYVVPTVEDFSMVTGSQIQIQIENDRITVYVE
jgi:DNA-binding CsgD family transcriptional regulator